MKGISIVGKNYNDTVLYLAEIIKCLDIKPIIRDMTRKHELYSSIPKVEGINPAEAVIDYHGIGYTFGERNGRKHDGEEDYLQYIRLYDYDMRPPEDDNILIVTNEEKYAADCLNMLQYLENEKEKAGLTRGKRIFLLKDYTGVIKDQFNSMLTNLGIEHSYCIPYSLQNAKCAVLAEYKAKFKFSGISNPYKDALRDIIDSFYGNIAEKKRAEALKQAMKGGIG